MSITDTFILIFPFSLPLKWTDYTPFCFVFLTFVCAGLYKQTNQYINIMRFRVYSDWTRQRQFDGVKHDTTHVSQSEHSDRLCHSAATAACVGIRSIIDAMLNRDKEMSQSEVVTLFLMPTIITE